MSRKPKVSDRLLLSYFKNLPKRFGEAYDATKYADLIQDEPWATMLENNDINGQNVTNALLRMVQRGYLERRGQKKASVYRLSDKGRKYLVRLETIEKLDEKQSYWLSQLERGAVSGSGLNREERRILQSLVDLDLAVSEGTVWFLKEIEDE